MALSPFFDFYRPSRLYDQQFGVGFSPTDIMPFYTFGNYCRPWKACEDSGSTVCMEKDKFCICLDVQQFRAEEITVKTVGKTIIVEGKHEERRDEHGFISRQFTRKYCLPEGFESEDVCSNLTADGVLMIEAKKKIRTGAAERIVPINKIAAMCQKNTSQCIKESAAEMKKDENITFEQNGRMKKDAKIEMKEDFKKSDDFKMKGKEERCCLLNADGTLKFTSDMSAAKTCSTQERMDFSSSSLTSEVTQSKESSFSSTEMSCGMRKGDKANDFISDIINAELKQVTDNL